MKSSAALAVCAIQICAQAPQPTHGGFSGTFSSPAFLPAPVTAAPYSGEEILTTLQILPDGTKITRARSMRKVYRDWAGRTREEQPLGPPAPSREGPPAPGYAVALVIITDPVEGARYLLDPVNRVAHRSKAQVTAPSTAPNPLRVQPTPGGPPRTPITRKPLGTEIINGFPAEGERRMTTSPPGFIGNDRPIVQVTEIWTSVDLKVPIRQITQDPARGESTVELTNINRSEPDGALFRPPANYTVVDETGPFSVGFSLR